VTARILRAWGPELFHIFWTASTRIGVRVLKQPPACRTRLPSSAGGPRNEDVVKVLLCADALPFEHFHNLGYFPHIGNVRFLDGHTVAFGAVVVHLPFGFHFRSRFSSACSVEGGDSIDMLIVLTETIRPAPGSLPSCPTHSFLPWL
jgi:hypothetical protein